MNDFQERAPAQSAGRSGNRENRASPEVRRIYRPWGFFTLDLLLTWGPLWLLVAGQRLGWFSQAAPLVILAGGSAMISAAIYVHTTGVRGFAKEFWIRAVDPRRIGVAWWPIILGVPFAINVAAVLLSLLSGGDIGQLNLSQQFLQAPLGFLLFILLFGPIPEELGWRGYGLDALRSRMNLLEASLLLGLIWALWHLPLVFVEGSFQHGLRQNGAALATYFIAFVPASILMSWIYYRTNRSTLSAILYHFAINASGELFELDLSTRVIQSVVALLVAAAVLYAERSLFTRREFWLPFDRGRR